MPKHPIVILDLKGDHALFHMMREDSARLGRKFLYFTPEPGRSSDQFNPFLDFDRSARSLSSFSNLVLDSLSLNHGDGYGPGYFTSRNRHLLNAVLKRNNPESFQQLYRLLQREVFEDRRQHQEAFELVATIEMLASYKNLQTTAADRLNGVRQIQMSEVIKHDQIAYFWLPAAVESISVREIGKLALYAIVSAAQARQSALEKKVEAKGDNQKARTKRVYVFIDEFQRLASENFSVVLEQARSLGVSLLLANQTISDLNTHSKDLRPTIRTNTRSKLMFSVTEPEEISAISGMSGQHIIETRARSIGSNRARFLMSRSLTETDSESIVPRLSTQDIQRISDHPSEFLLQVSRGSGFTQFAGLPVRVRTTWPMPKAEYDRLSRLFWPALESTQGSEAAEPTMNIRQLESKARENAETHMRESAESIRDLPEVRDFPRTDPPNKRDNEPKD